jgi:hypothetical protein
VLEPDNGTIQTWTLTGASTPTDGFAAGQGVTLMIADGTAYTITWTTLGVTWVGGSAPTLPTSGYAVISLWKVGGTIYGAWPTKDGLRALSNLVAQHLGGTRHD